MHGRSAIGLVAVAWPTTIGGSSFCIDATHSHVTVYQRHYDYEEIISGEKQMRLRHYTKPKTPPQLM